MTVVPKRRAAGLSAAEVESRLTFADAALSLAGHEVKDLETRELGRRIARGEISGDEAVQLTKDRFLGRV